MFRKFAAAALALVLATLPAQAEIEIKRYANLSKVNCEDAQTIADMEEIYGRMKNKSGVSLISVYGQPKILSAKPRTKTGNKLTCALSVRFPGPGAPRVRGTMTLTIFPNGKYNVKWLPGN